jgi:hypothetical protein
LQLTLAAGVAFATITVTPINDTDAELNETVALALSSGSGYTLGTPSSQSGTILDNDLPTVSIAGASVTEGNSGTKTVVLTVTLSGPKSTPITVAYATANGTAVAPTDYQSKTGTLTFAAGITTQTISITIVGDRTKEPNETFLVTLSNPSGATLGTGSATVTILDDDSPLVASEPAAELDAATGLTAAQLDAVVEQAKAIWLAAVPTLDLSEVSFSIAELDGLFLGLTAGREVTLDATAAGYGWFVDSTPGGGETPVGRMDLLSVVTHEIGHVLGFDHDDASSYRVMAEDLEAGVRNALADPQPKRALQTAQTATPATGRGRGEANFADWLVEDARPAGWSARWNTSTGDFDEDAKEWNPYLPFQTTKPRKGIAAKLWRAGTRWLS